MTNSCLDLAPIEDRDYCRVIAGLTKKMERAFTLSIAILIILTVFTQGSPVNEENDSTVMRRNSLLEKLGMELHRDPFYSPYRRRGIWRWWRRRYRKRKGKKGSGEATTGTDSQTDSNTDSGSDSDSGSGKSGKYSRYSKYGK